MTADLVLESYLDQTAATGDLPAAAARAVAAIAAAGRTIAELLAAGPLAGALAASVGSPANDWGDAQKALDIRAHDMMLAALHAAGVASVLSEEAEQPVAVDAAGRVAVAIDPLDGSSNIDTNVPVGTIFSILPAAAGFLVPGHMQIAAGFMIYGVNTGLAVTFGDGTRLFTLDRSRGVFRSTGRPIAIPPQTAEFAINSSNRRHWDIAIRAYIDGCLAGAAGLRGRNFNTRWLASLVGEAYRILIRGGIYLYPADDRTGYRHGRLRLIYEANPVAMLAEQAGGASTDGRTRILDLVPHSVHQRTPLVFGSRDEVAEIAACYHRPASDYTSPLFSPRSLFRA
jgi:fructose-1,6-bisphosphatase I